MTRNLTLSGAQALPPQLAGCSIALVGLMGVGKSAIGRRLAARLGLPFRDADTEIELAAGCPIAEIFERFGEAAFRAGEKRVIRRLLAGEPIVLASGGGAFMDPEIRVLLAEKAVTLWLDCPFPILLRRVVGRTHRPLLKGGDPEEILTRLAAQRNPIYAEADLHLICSDEPAEGTAARALALLMSWQKPCRLKVDSFGGAYDVIIGQGLLARAGALLAPVLPQKRVVIVADAAVAGLYLPSLRKGLAETGFAVESLVVQGGEKAKSVEVWARLLEDLLALGIERRSTVIALGGGVIGDLAGFTAATTLRGLPFVQVPTTLLAQVDSSIGGKTGINSPLGKNLIGAFHPPRAVIADTATLASLSPRELRAGYAEIVKAGLIGATDFFAWCERFGAAVLAGEAEPQAEAILRACTFKAKVIAADEREERSENGRALLNLGHTFGHALEAELGYSDELLHGEAVAIGLYLAGKLSVALGYCATEEAERLRAHLDETNLLWDLRRLKRRFSAASLIGRISHDKKRRDGALAFVLLRGIGHAFTCTEVPEAAVEEVLREAGCEA